MIATVLSSYFHKHLYAVALVAEKQQQREGHALPLPGQLKAWLDKSSLQVPPTLGKAIAYTLKQWPKLVRYSEYGQPNIDNNRAERAVKPFVIGRKNWLFSNTARGAQASATLYSLVETAKANGLAPFGYIKRLLEELPTQPDGLQYLMPWNIKRQGWTGALGRTFTTFPWRFVWVKWQPSAKQFLPGGYFRVAAIPSS